jgi:hypothetical protein
MNFLQLAQSLRQECGVSGSGPSSTVSQTGEAKRLVDWINAAWLEIQGLHDTWHFMRDTFSFQTVAGTGDYTPTAAGLSDHRYWFKDTLRTYKTALGLADEQWLIEWEYQVFRNTYRFGLQTTQQGRPVVFAEKPMDKALMLGSVPDDVYTVVGEYQKKPTQLSGDTDTPEMPEHLHQVIVYKAMEYYGLFESAPEVLSRARTGYSALKGQLEREQLPAVYLGNPLA